MEATDRPIRPRLLLPVGRSGADQDLATEWRRHPIRNCRGMKRDGCDDGLISSWMLPGRDIMRILEAAAEFRRRCPTDGTQLDVCVRGLDVGGIPWATFTPPIHGTI